jgi:hypothetical protein
MPIYLNAKCVSNYEMEKTIDKIRKENLLTLIAETGKKSKLADLADTNAAYISQLLSKNPKKIRNIGDDLARKLESACGKTRGWMDTDHDKFIREPNKFEYGNIKCKMIAEWETPSDLPEGSYAFIQRVKISLSAGNGSYVTEEQSGNPLAFTSKWIRERNLNKKDLVCVDVTGDSMEPYLNDGDVVLINTADKQVINNSIYAIRYNDELRIKRLFIRFDGYLIISSDNHMKYRDEIASPNDIENYISIIGKMVWLSREPKY